MLKLFTRLYLFMLVFIVVLVLSLDSMVLGNPFTRDKMGNDLATGVISPMFHSIETQLLPLPPQEWAGQLQKLRPTLPHYPLSLVPLTQAPFTGRQMKDLEAGKIILDLNYSTSLDTAVSRNGQSGPVVYHRIGESSYTLAYPLLEGEDTNTLAQQGWLLSFILSDLARGISSQTLSAKYGVPVQLVMTHELAAPLQTFLMHNPYYYTAQEHFPGLPVYFYYVMNDQQVLEIGPYPYSWYIQHFRLIWFLIAVGVVALVMLISLYPFYRSFSKLERLAEEYGHGRFDSRIQIKPYSALYQFYRNLSGMAFKIKSLLSSQQALIQAVSHELKTPLARLKFAVKMDNKDEANHAINELDHMISELLLYNTLESQDFKLEFQTIPFKAWLEKLTKLPIETSDSSENIQVSLAPLYFQKVIENLLSNAKRYAKSKIAIRLDADATHCYLHVADDGAGIPEADRSRIFEPFVSLDESRNKELSGHGLGLALVARIVAMHQGQISVKTSPWGGAEFVISLPRKNS